MQTTDLNWLDKHYVSSSVIRSLYSHIQANSEPVKLDQIPFSFDEIELNDTNFRYSSIIYYKLMEYAAEHMNDPSFGFHYGQSAETTRWGIMGYLLSVCDNVQQALSCQSRFQSLVGNIGCTIIHSNQNTFTMEWFTEGAPGKQLAEEAIAGWVTFGRAITNTNYKPLEVSFRHEMPENIAEYEAFFQCPVNFNQTANALSFSPDFLLYPLKQTDKRMFELLNIHADQLLDESNTSNFDQQIKAFVTREMSKSLPSIEDVARRFNTSTRSLQRQFKEWGTSYSDYVNEIRLEFSLNYFKRGGQNLLELALLLGYSEQSAFQRAFKRWTGRTPKQYMDSD